MDDGTILRRIERQPRQSAGFKQLVRELGARGDDRRLLSERLRALVERGDLVEIEHGRYALPRAAEHRNLVSGRLSMHRDGYGFVTPESAELKARVTGDIYIPPPAIGPAMHGDRVLVEMGPVRSDGRAEGRVVRIAGRAHATVVGTFHYGARHNTVTPIDEKITQEIIIPPGMEWPETPDAEENQKPERHRVIGKEARRREVPKRVDAGEPSPQRTKTGLAGGPESPAKSALPQPKSAGESPASTQAAGTEWEDLDGVVVDVEITHWPSTTQQPRGRVVEILGFEDDFGVDVEIIIRKFHVPHRFPSEVLEEAQAAAQMPLGDEMRARRDFRQLPIVTIDGETARDFDDAVAVRRLAHGHSTPSHANPARDGGPGWELQVHIADVAHYVREGSAIDDEARLRGTSVYFPDRAVPMLPLELSTDVCSLRPQLDRPVLSCVMEIDPRGEIVGYELCEGMIRSAERMTYTDVNAVLEGDPRLRQRYAPLAESFELMKELALILNRKRVRRGSIDFDLPEPVIEFDEFGLMRSITRSERNIAHRLIEEFMLAANESVASYLEQKEIGSLYRIHEPPDAKRVLEFETIAARFGYSLGVGVLPVQRMTARADRRAAYGTGRHAPQFEIPQDIRITPRMYQKLTQKLAGKPEERILSYLMLRSLKQARYSEDNVGHFALAAPSYTHFTSPIRRYPDLIVHRILKQVLRDSAEQRDGEVPVGRGVPVSRPYGEELEAGQKPHGASHGHMHGKHDRKGRRDAPPHLSGAISGPMELDELHDIAEQSSQTERRADDAERELMEWKKLKFMHDRMGEEFTGLIVSVTKFGFFVELTELFVEGLVPLATLTGDRYTYRENTRQIIGERSKHAYSLGDTVRVWVDRIDRMQRKIQFAVVQEEKNTRGARGKKRGKSG